MEKALLWFKVEIVELGDLKDILYCGNVIGHVGVCRDTNVIHVNTDRGALEFVLKDNITIDVVHHGLEGGR